MKYFIENVPEITENEVIIRCRMVDKSVKHLIHFLEEPPPKLLGEIDKDLHILKPEKILYIESLDRKVFIVSGENVYESRKKLYELEEELADHDFFRASKWMILNINVIESVRPLFDGRFEALLVNKKKVFISRKYVSDLKKKLGIDRRN